MDVSKIKEQKELDEWVKSYDKITKEFTTVSDKLIEHLVKILNGRKKLKPKFEPLKEETSIFENHRTLMEKINILGKYDEASRYIYPTEKKKPISPLEQKKEELRHRVGTS